MITDQFDANRHPAQIGVAVPHAASGMVGHPFFVHDAVGAPVAGNHIMRMTTIGTSAISKLFPFGDDPQGVIASEFRRVDDDIFRGVAFDFFEPGVQPRTIIDDGTLKAVAVRNGKRA